MRKFYVVFCLLLVASLLTACSPTKAEVSMMINEAMAKLPVPQQPIVNVEVPEQLAPEVNIEVPEQPAPVINIEVPEQPAPVVNVQVLEPEVLETEELVIEPITQEPVQESETVQEKFVAECPLTDKGVRLEFGGPKEGEFYLISGLSESFAAYEGCNFLFEGRQFLTKEHHIWVFQGSEWQLKVREGSLWAYPSDWNMVDFSTEKPPIAAEFVTAKRQNQLMNDYDWVIFVHDGENIYEFPAGQDTPVVVLPDNAQFSEPEPLVVQGVWDGEVFNASIGAENTITIAFLDGKLFYWQDAVDNISYKSVQAWIMPSGWSFEQIEGWAEENFPSQDLVEYIG